MQDIIQGICRFRTDVFPRQADLFARLASGQNPTALMVCCADSRVDMGLVTQAEPGQLFLIRNAGNIVPPLGPSPGGVSSGIEYAMIALRVPNIIVCGHSDCGAMKGVVQPELVRDMPVVRHWLGHAEVSRQRLLANPPDDPADQLDHIIRENVLAQLLHLQTHPSVVGALARRKVRLHGWVYDIHSGRVDAYDAHEDRWTSLAPDSTFCATPRHLGGT